ncbi:MAG: ABC transporter permease [Clostridiales bacterium]|nr:ABC transporter permease [Clostridiales bacterium]
MKKLISRLYLGLVFIFLYAPIFVLIAYSFNESKSRAHWTGFSLKWYERLFQDDDIIKALLASLLVAVIASVCATLLGTAAAVGISNMRKLPRSVMINVTYLPVINPEIVMGVSLMLLFLFFENTFGLMRGMFTVLVAHITFSLPYVILNVLPKLRQMDQNLFEAAQDLGCTPMQAFRKVVIPEIMPGIFSGFLMAFTFSLDDFIVTLFVSGPKFSTLPLAIYSMTRRKVSPSINALSTIIFVIVLTILIIYNVVDAKQQKKNERKVVR